MNKRDIFVQAELLFSYISSMSNIKKLNQRLGKIFNGKVCAMLNRGVLYLTGELDNWDDIVKAGLMSVNQKEYSVVNDIHFTGGKIPTMRMPTVASNKLEGECPDVLVIGGGVVGCAIARELMRYKIDVLLVEKEHDVALHASGRNDGVVLPEISMNEGELKKKYNDIGSHLYPLVCDELDVPFKRTGQYVCFTSNLMKPAALASIAMYALQGITVEYISRKDLLKKEPHLSRSIKFALFFPTAGIVYPYGLTTAYAENASDNGAKISLDTVVLDIQVWNGTINNVLTNRGRIYPKIVINAAGVFAEDIARLAQDRFFSLHPRRSTNMIFDKKASYLVKSIVSPYETARMKSVGVLQTVDGNLLTGYDSIETYKREDFSTDTNSIISILAKQQELVPSLSGQDIVASFTGISAATYEGDFVVSFGKFTDNIIHAAGLGSPGLTAAPAIAKEVSVMAAKYLGAGINREYNPLRRMAIDESENFPDAACATVPDSTLG